MEPKYADPACIKFINGKFVLATNDPKNPIAMVRQKTKGIETEVIVTLSTGESYEDTIDSLASLVEVTSNKGWSMRVTMDIGMNIDSDSANVNTACKLKKLFDEIYNFGYYPNCEYYLPVSPMTPKRIRLTEVTSAINFVHMDTTVRGSGTVDMEFVILAPQSCIGNIEEDITNDIVSHFRTATQTSAIYVYDRNVSSSDVEECDPSAAIEDLASENIYRTLVVKFNNKTYSSPKVDTTTMAKILVTSLP